MRMKPCRLAHDASKRVLYTLQANNRVVRNTIEQRVTIVNFRLHYSISKKNGGICIERWSNLSELTDLQKWRTADRGDVRFKIKTGIKNNSKVPRRGDRRQCKTLEIYWAANNVGSLQRCANEKINYISRCLSFRTKKWFNFTIIFIFYVFLFSFF